MSNQYRLPFLYQAYPKVSKKEKPSVFQVLTILLSLCNSILFSLGFSSLGPK